MISIIVIESRQANEAADEKKLYACGGKSKFFLGRGKDWVPEFEARRILELRRPRALKRV